MLPVADRGEEQFVAGDFSGDGQRVHGLLDGAEQLQVGAADAAGVRVVVLEGEETVEGDIAGGSLDRRE